ncbi:MAG: hypothetical protein OXT67_08400, partial [Zetaproteobacteria bacterium]|nr:hypothetical protein [Zetaproteobacteria bacterium]
DAPRSKDLRFDFPTNSPDKALEKATVFVNATNHLQWFRQLPTATQLWQPKQIYLNVLTPINNNSEQRTQYFDPNKAEYRPGTSKSRASILLAAGDRVALENLLIDPDVVAHELGHDFIYHRITSTQGESVVLHEGLADYFVMAHTKDSCLGNSICPNSSTTCAHPPRCLRDANNDLTFTGKLPEAHHAKGQLFSGLMWDIGKQIGHTESASLLAGAIFFLKSNSGYSEFITSLLVANQKFFQNKHYCSIQSSLIKRGFEKQLQAAMQIKIFQGVRFPECE